MIFKIRNIIVLLSVIIIFSINTQSFAINKNDTTSSILLSLDPIQHISNKKQILDLCDSNIEIARAKNQKFNEACLWGQKAYIHYNYGNYDMAMGYFHQAYQLFEQNGDSLGMIRSLVNIGNVSLSLLDYTKSSAYYHKALQRSEENNFINMVYECEIILAEYFLLTNQNTNASELLFDAFEIQSNNKDVITDNPKMTTRLGTAFLNFKDYNKAKQCFQYALDNHFRKGNLHDYYNVLIQKGNLYYLTDSIHSCIYNYKKVITESNQTGEYDIYFSAIIKLSEVYLNLKKHSETIEILDLGQQKALSLNNKTFLSQIYFAKQSYYATTGDYILQKKYLEEYNLENDTIYDLESQQRIQGIIDHYESEKKSRELVDLKIQSSYKTKFLYLSIGIFVLILISLILIINRISLKSRLLKNEKEKIEIDKLLKQKENKNLHIELDHKNRKLVTTSVYINCRSQLLENIQIQLDKIKVNSKKDRKIIDTIFSEIKDNLNLLSDWESLKSHFEDVHPEFFEKLSNNYPHLTQNDLKYCAYIRMNLTTKEIARILNIDARAVQTARYRLKKKMNIEESVSLVNYINQF